MEDHTPTDQAAPRLDQIKAALRQVASARRAAILPDAAARAAVALAAPLIRFVADRLPPPAVIAGYWPIGTEIDVRPALNALRETGYVLALPETTPRHTPLRFRQFDDGVSLVAGRFGTWYPPGPEIRPDLLLVPLLAFDAAGRRLGYGGGYYDRTLAALGVPAIGCGFGAQEVPEIPSGPNDIALTAVATESGLRLFTSAATHRAPGGAR